MEAFRIGAIVMAAPRFYAGLALLTLIVAAELLAWRRRRAAAIRNDPSGRGEGAAFGVPPRAASAPQHPADTAAWAWSAAGAVLVGSRLGFVLENFDFFRLEPLTAFAFWQGGFSPWWGVAAGVAVTLWSFRRDLAGVKAVLGPTALSLAVWLVVPAVLSPAEALPTTLPTVAIERLEGGTLDFAALRGQPVVINLWATWCPPCRRELPQFARAAATYPDVHFVFANQGESRDVVAAYLAERPDVTLTNVVLDRSQSVGQRFGSLGLPTTYFFDAQGNHVLTHVGEVSTVALLNHLTDLRR